VQTDRLEVADEIRRVQGDAAVAAEDRCGSSTLATELGNQPV
jgi:hypothetical protein